MSLFPIFVKLEGRPVLLVGAGPVGESKIGGLLSAGAAVTVVAPTATPGIQKLAAGRQDLLASARIRAGRSERHDARRRGGAERRRAARSTRRRRSAASSSIPSTTPTTAISTIRPSSIAATFRSPSRRRATARPSRNVSASSSSSSSARNTRTGSSSWATRGASCLRRTWIPRRASRSCTSSPRAKAQQGAAYRRAWCIWWARARAIRNC